MIKKTLSHYFRRLNNYSWSGRVVLLMVQAVLLAALAQLLETPVSSWVLMLVIASLFILFTGGLDSYLAQRAEQNIQKTLDNDVGKELVRLQKAKKRAESLQNMSSTLRTSLNYEKVVEAALDVCGLAFEEMGLPARSLIGAVMLMTKAILVPLASRGFVMRDMGK
ncbi:MAG: hypothetical protein IPL78_25705 [Chloroflexi bacterium]|nr:hypothetical protein [Chloroflexota bacterium]